MKPRALVATLTGAVLTVFLSVVFLSGCQTIPDPEIPPREKASSSVEANALLRQYHLT